MCVGEKPENGNEYKNIVGDNTNNGIRVLVVIIRITLSRRGFHGLLHLTFNFFREAPTCIPVSTCALVGVITNKDFVLCCWRKTPKMATNT